MLISRKLAVRGTWLFGGFLLACAVMPALGLLSPARIETEFLMAMALAVFGLVLCATFGENALGFLRGHDRVVPMRSYRWPQYHFYGGSPLVFKKYFEFEAGDPEKIALVAIKHPNGNIYAVERPGRHHHVLQLLAEMGLNPKGKEDQGFVTNRGVYVSRSAALIIAAAAKQLDIRSGAGNELFSEDLWATPKAFREPAIETTDTQEQWPRGCVLASLPPLESLRRATVEAAWEAEEAEEQALRKTLMGMLAPHEPQKLKLPEGVLDARGVRGITYLAEEFCITLDEHVERFTGVATSVNERPWSFDGYESVRSREQALVYLERLVHFAEKRRTYKAQFVLHNDPNRQLNDSEQLRHLLKKVMGEDDLANCDLIREMAQRLISLAQEENVYITIDLQPDPQRPGRLKMLPTAVSMRAPAALPMEAAS